MLRDDLNQFSAFCGIKEASLLRVDSSASLVPRNHAAYDALSVDVKVMVGNAWLALPS